MDVVTRHVDGRLQGEGSSVLLSAGWIRGEETAGIFLEALEAVA
ncbi:hypothetical protein ACFCX0_47015 [Streptomyces sp. NPDC056352]